jgi:hypothetical protein
MPRVIYHEQNLRRSVHHWFQSRKRCFMYHYHTVSESRTPEDWINLNTVAGCRYHGWVQMSYSHRGELWSYATQQHRTLITMRVQGERLLWPEQYRKIARTLRSQQRDWEHQIKRLVRTHGDQYGFWVG